MPEAAKGIVLRVEKTSIHDGEGLRTVLFLKGCPLRCLWCSTPESQSLSPEKAFVRDKCVMCGRCALACPRGAISEGAGERMLTDKAKCVMCFECVKKCPSGAMISYGEEFTSEEAVAEISKDEIFYFHSGGGVTISGGEPLEQAEFVKEILIDCGERGIHRAIETSFFAPWSKIETLLPHLDLLYVDIKSINAARHALVAGARNERILDNIRLAANSPFPFDMVIRAPIIPGVNDDDRELAEAGRFAGGLGKVETLELLAYHRLGTETYRSLDLEYPLRETPVPDEEYMKAKARILADSSGKRILINGLPFDA